MLFDILELVLCSYPASHWLQHILNTEQASKICKLLSEIIDIQTLTLCYVNWKSKIKTANTDNWQRYIKVLSLVHVELNTSLQKKMYLALPAVPCKFQEMYYFLQVTHANRLESAMRQHSIRPEVCQNALCNCLD